MKDINLRLRVIAAMADPKSDIGLAINLLLKDVERDQKKRASQCERTRRCVAKKREANVNLTVSLTPHPNTSEREANVNLTSLYVDNSTVALKELERIEESKIQHASPKRARGTRLPDHWKPSFEDRQYAKAAGIPESEIDRVAEEFVDYWTSVPGSKGVKLKWDGTWRSRIRAISERYSAKNITRFPAKPKPLTPYQQNQAEWKERLDAVAKFAYGDDAAQQAKPKNGGPLDASDDQTFPFGRYSPNS